MTVKNRNGNVNPRPLLVHGCSMWESELPVRVIRFAGSRSKKIVILPLKFEQWVFFTTQTLFSVLLSIVSLYTPFSTLNPFVDYMLSGIFIICFSWNHLLLE